MTSRWPPGWYPDPWAATGMRWWDGSEWADGRGSSQEPGRRPSRWLSPRRWHWGVVVTLVVMVAAAGEFFGTTPSSSRSAESAPPTTSVPEPTITVPPGATTAPPVDELYLATGSGYVDFVEFSDDGGSVSGTAQSVRSAGSPPQLSTKSESLTVTGSLSGTNIELSFDNGPRSSGTVDGGSLTLNFPQSGGALAPVTLAAVPSAAAFDGAVASLDQNVAQANQVAENSEQQDAVQKLETDASAVIRDIASLRQQESTTSGLVQAIPKDLQEESGDLAVTQAAEQQVMADVQQGTIDSLSAACPGAESVAGDAQGVVGGAQVVEADAQSVDAGLVALRNGVSAVNSDFARLQSDAASFADYSSQGGQEAVDQADNEAGEAISSALSAANSDIGTANSDVTTAFAYSAQAFEAGGCGAAPNAPAPQPTIS